MPIIAEAWSVVSTSMRSSRRSIADAAGVPRPYFFRFAESGRGPLPKSVEPSAKAPAIAADGMCMNIEDMVHVPADGTWSLMM